MVSVQIVQVATILRVAFPRFENGLVPIATLNNMAERTNWDSNPHYDWLICEDLNEIQSTLRIIHQGDVCYTSQRNFLGTISQYA